MRRRRWWIGIALAALVLFGVKFTLFNTAASPGAPYQIDLAALHRAANEQGPLPTAIEVERVADFAFPRALVVAGGGFSMHPMILVVHRVTWPDGRSIILDSALSQDDAAALPGSEFHRAAYERMEKALPRAEQILFTHEHVDHVGGVAASPSFAALSDKVRITEEQLAGPRLERDKWAPGTLEQLKPLSYSGILAVAPGIALQKAPGHSTGTQLIYVELASGARYLFVGDIAWSEDNIALQRGRPLLAALVIKEDRASVASQLQALAALPKDVHLVVAHDPVAFARDLKAGLYRERFSAP
jgi:glyoxylase-like metal-dependent hydrolase (beta-lactamase superfamily II)